MTSFGSALNYQRLEGLARAMPQLGATYAERRRQGRHIARVGHARLRILLARRTAEFVGLPRQPVLGARICLRPADVLPADLSAARTPRAGLYAGASAEVGQIRDRFDSLPSPGTLWSASAFLGADTFLGPAFLGFGYGASRQLEPLPAARRAIERGTVQVKNPDDANLGFDFGVSGELQRTRGKSHRYSAMVDLISSKPTATIELHEVAREERE